jgi:alkanesulfonate monooxygenase SsuD/methylene tetrahydromethanopterin reductase-like flavin-dependent oxidoreductase (luciferase family)
VKYGFVLPPMDARAAVEAAVDAEQAGWDGYFLSEGMWSVDAWLCLSAAAVRTDTIHLGTLLTPLSIMRPWKLASEASTLDHLSGGRVILTVGMGAPDVGFAAFGEATDLRIRAALVDEGLDLINLLWRGEPFRYSGEHYAVDTRSLSVFSVPKPVQQPRIPIWVVGAWPRPKSMRRALRCDGVLPYVKPRGQGYRATTPEDVRAIKAYVAERRKAPPPFDIVIEGTTPPDDPKAAKDVVRAWQEAGASWWIESIWDQPMEARMARLREGPPRLES